MLLNYNVEKTFENPLDCKEIKPVIPKGNQSWIFIDAEVSIIWPPDVKSWLFVKDLDAGKDWKQKEKGVAKDEMVSITDSMDMNLSKLREQWRTGEPNKLQSSGLKETQLSNWTTKSQDPIHV